MSKAREKRYVLRVDLNKDNEETCLMGRGKSFHNLGAATANARSPLSLRFVFGTFRSSWSADLRESKKQKPKHTYLSSICFPGHKAALCVTVPHTHVAAVCARVQDPASAIAQWRHLRLPDRIR